MNEHDVNANLQILSASFVNHKFLPEYKDSFPPHTSSNGHLLKPIDSGANVPRVSCVSPMMSKMHRYIYSFMPIFILKTWNGFSELWHSDVPFF